MRNWKKSLCMILIIAMLTMGLTACGNSAPKPVNTATGTYDEMVKYLTDKGYIAKDTAPVDINSTEGYVQDNTGGEMPFAMVADKAEDYGGLWLFWWDTSDESEADEYLEQLDYFDGLIVVWGGACVLQTEARSGCFAIAFAEDYAQKDAVLEDFNSLPSE